MGRVQDKNQFFVRAGIKHSYQGLGLWLTPLVVVLATSPLYAQMEKDPIPRLSPKKPNQTLVRPTQNKEDIILKFREGSGIRLRGGSFVVGGDASAAQIDLSELENILAAHNISAEAIERLHARPEIELDEERKRAEFRSGRQMADLNLYYKLKVQQVADVEVLCDQLNSLQFVEKATPGILPAPPPINTPHPTPDFSESQRYRNVPLAGIGALDPAMAPVCDGIGTTVLGFLYSWQLDRENLELDAIANIDTEATLKDPFNSKQQGTVVLRELGGVAKASGVTGIVPATILLVSPAHTEEFS